MRTARLVSLGLVWLVCACSPVDDSSEAALVGHAESASADRPAVASLSPQRGPIAGGTAVLIEGRGLHPHATVWFGGSRAQKTLFLTSQALIAVTPPAGAPGLVDVKVQLPRAQVIVPRGFEYTADPVRCVAAVSPGFDARAVAVTATPTVRWPVRLDESEAKRAVRLKVLGGDDVPFDADVSAGSGETKLVVRPRALLRFWAHYALTIEATGSKDRGCLGAMTAFSTKEPVVVPGPRFPFPAASLAAAGDVVFAVSKAAQGLQWYRHARGHLQLKGELPLPHPAVKVVVFEDRAYLPLGTKGVLVLDISQPTSPSVLAHVGTPGTAVDVALFRRGEELTLLVADHDEGLRLVDVTDPRRTRDLARLLPPNDTRAVPTVQSVTTDGSLAAIAHSQGYFALVDLSDAAQPRIVHNTDLGNYTAQALLAQERIYVANSSRLVVFDRANPSTPAETIPACVADGCLGGVVALALQGRRLYALHALPGITLFEDQGRLIEKGRIAPPSRPMTLLPTTTDLLVGVEGGVVAYEAHGGAAPTARQDHGPGIVRDVVLSPTHVYAVGNSRGIHVFDGIDPLGPLLVGRVPTPAASTSDASALGIGFAGQTLVVADGRRGLSTFDVKDPADPRFLDRTAFDTDTALEIVTHGSRLFACDGNAGIVEATLHANGTIASARRHSFSTFGPAPRLQDGCIALAWDRDRSLLFVGSQRGLSVLDVLGSEVRALGHLVLPELDQVVGLALTGTRLFASLARLHLEGAGNRLSRLAVVDVAMAAEPRLVHLSPEVGGAGPLTVIGTKLFGAAAQRGLVVFDLAVLDHPQVEGAIALPGVPHRTVFSSGAAYVAAAGAGLVTVDTGPLPEKP